MCLHRYLTHFYKQILWFCIESTIHILQADTTIDEAIADHLSSFSFKALAQQLFIQGKEGKSQASSSCLLFYNKFSLVISLVKENGDYNLTFRICSDPASSSWIILIDFMNGSGIQCNGTVLEWGHRRHRRVGWGNGGAAFSFPSETDLRGVITPSIIVQACFKSSSIPQSWNLKEVAQFSAIIIMYPFNIASLKHKYFELVWNDFSKCLRV